MTDHRMTDEEAAFNAQQAAEVATKDEVIIEPINFVDSARQCDICGFAHEKKQFLGQGWRRGAGVLRGGKAGRREKDDPEALAWAESLFSAGIAKTQAQACRIVAQYYSPTYQVASASARLRGKLRAKLIKYMADE